MVFDTKYSDKEATIIIKDTSDRYFTFYQVHYDGNTKVNYIGNSIWGIVGRKKTLEEKLKSDEESIK